MLHKDDELFMTEVEKSFKSYFPNARFEIGYYKLFGEYIQISFGLVALNELTGNYEINDPVKHSYLIDMKGDDYVVESRCSGISINPEEGSYMAMGRVKTGFRNFTLSPEKSIKRFQTFFKRLRVLVDVNESNIYQRANYSDKYFK